MQIFSYRNKLRLRTLLTILIVLAVLLAAAAAAYVIYLGRYMVYSEDGSSYLSYPGYDSPNKPDETAVSEITEPIIPENVEIGETIEKPADFSPVSEAAESGEEETVLTVSNSGYYADSAMMQDPTAVSEAISEILETWDSKENGMLPIMLDLKSEYGNFYYSSSLSFAPAASSVDVKQIDALIASLADNSDIYLMARVHAFRDMNYALENQSMALALSSGALWADSSFCYWMDPAEDTVLNRLSTMCTELGELGFDEVVFRSFTFPDAEGVVYDGDWSEILTTAAERITNSASVSISFSYCDEEPMYEAAAFGSRVLLAINDIGELTEALAPISAVSETAAQNVAFLTESHDTRLHPYLLLRPLVSVAE